LIKDYCLLNQLLFNYKKNDVLDSAMFGDFIVTE